MITHDSRSNLLKTLLNFLAVVLLIGLLGCDRLVLSERQKVLKASHEAVCGYSGPT